MQRITNCYLFGPSWRGGGWKTEFIAPISKLSLSLWFIPDRLLWLCSLSTFPSRLPCLACQLWLLVRNVCFSQGLYYTPFQLLTNSQDHQRWLERLRTAENKKKSFVVRKLWKHEFEIPLRSRTAAAFRSDSPFGVELEQKPRKNPTISSKIGIRKVKSKLYNPHKYKINFKKWQFFDDVNL